MELSSDVHKFSSACEHLLASVAIHRPLEDDEVRLVEYYYKEVLKKVVPPPTNPERDRSTSPSVKV